MANFAKPSVPQFSVDVYQNEYLPVGGRDVDAVVTVTATGGGTSGATGVTAGGPAGVVIMVDCSGSMDYPPTKMEGARAATAAAIDTLRDGTSFAVVAGNHVATPLYPGDGRLAVAGARTRAEAKEALGRLHADGGTAIGTWLRLADALLGGEDLVIRHAVLLTDGRNEHESPESLRAALDACAGRFTCDARGVGTDWEVKEVTGIASALLGSADIVADPAGEVRDYHVRVRVPANAVGQEMLAARVSLIVPDPAGGDARPVSQGLIRAVWTHDVAMTTAINPQVAHYTGQAELADAIQAGLDARKSGDQDGATAKLGRAVQLAAASGNADTAKLLSKVVDVVDAAAGTVRLKAKVAEADEMTLETRSTKTVRVKR